MIPKIQNPQTPDSVRTGYDRWASVYDHDGNPLIAIEEPIVRKISPDVRGKSVLDLGCGTGRHSLWLAAAGANVTAVDFSPQMLAAAKSKTAGHSIRFITHDLHQPLPFQNSEFDFVISGLVIEHISNLPAIFSEIHRVLRPTGQTIITSMHPAMLLLGTQARFTDTTTNTIIQPGSYSHQLGDMTMSVINAGLHLTHFSEHPADAELAKKYPRAEKYIGWPMLVVLGAQLTPK